MKIERKSTKAFVTLEQNEKYPETLLLFVQEDSRNRTFYKKNCENCKEIFYSYKKGAKYHSYDCYDNHNYSESRIDLTCANCNKKFTRRKSQLLLSKHKKYFCSRDCKNIGQSFDGNCPEIRPPHFGSGKYNYRDKARRAYDPICMKCGYSEDSKLLDIDHIDGNRDNNKLENLQVLCVMCHAKKTRKDWPPFWKKPGE